VPAALKQLLQLLDHMAAADELMERFDQGIEALASLPAGSSELQLFETRYASVQIWARKGRFDMAAGVVCSMLKALEV
jgi:predicted Rdx family selenoprotein